MNLTGEQWQVLEPLIGEMPRRADGRGRPWRSSWEMLDGILWILRTGAQWADLPERYRQYRPCPCQRRFQRRVRDSTLERVLEAPAQDLTERGKLDLSECFITAPAWWQKGGGCVGTTKRGKGPKLMGKAGQWQTVLIFLAPCVPPRIRLTGLPSSLLPSTPAW